MKYKVGDRVRIVDHRTEEMNRLGRMDKWLGKIMTIKAVGDIGYKMEEDRTECTGYGWLWLDDMIAGLADEESSTETINIQIDPSDPKTAHEAVTAAIKAHEERKRDWTDAEIEQAKELSRELIVKLFDAGCSLVWYENGLVVSSRANYGGTEEYPAVKFGAKSNVFYSLPNGNDVFNEHIGKCVCLCKLTNTPIPDFIRNKNKED